MKIGVESTGNIRFFKNLVEKAGAGMSYNQRLKFKVINESTKKPDKHDASAISEFLEKGMLSEGSGHYVIALRTRARSTVSKTDVSNHSPGD